jgi:hypothetical protein
LAYRELFPKEYRYTELTPALRRLCESWTRGERELRRPRPELVAPHEPARVAARFHALFETTCG